MAHKAIVIVDVAGSTPLFAREGDAVAMRRITGCLDRVGRILRTFDGRFIVSRGDDVHYLFERQGPAFAAIEVVLADPLCRALDLHVALHWGEVLESPDGFSGNLFGDAVNLAARLAAASNPGEALLSRDFAEGLAVEDHARLRRISGLALKGREGTVEAFALSSELMDASARTVTPRTGRVAAGFLPGLILTEGRTRILLAEGQTLAIGRAEGCAIRQESHWVSRLHATLRLRNGRAELTDRSSNGVWVAPVSGPATLVRRETVVLLGSGRLSAGVPLDSPLAMPIHFAASANAPVDAPAAG
jgi:class 3 adenylate cyclase